MPNLKMQRDLKTMIICGIEVPLTVANKKIEQFSVTPEMTTFPVQIKDKLYTFALSGLLVDI